jgi:hypothetical protein
VSVERWDTSARWTYTGDTARDLRALEHNLGRLIEVEDTDAADAQIALRHGLGRVPTGMRVVNVVTGVAGDCSWYRLDPDDTWDERIIRFRFRTANLRVLLEVF